MLLATWNTGKARELTHLLKTIDMQAVSLGDCGIDEPFEESGATYEENARGKAVYYAGLAGRVAVADDSGIEVDALDGRPGVLSARYGDPALDDTGRCRLMLEELRGVVDEKRTARYVAVAAVARPDGEARIFRGLCEGRILSEMRGDGGFGYDPLFFYPPLGATFAELPHERKHEVSHRGHAFRALAGFFGSEEGRRFVGSMV